MLKKIVIGLAVIVILVVSALLVGPALVPKDWLREEITAQVKDATGRDLVIEGDLEFQLLPEAVVNLGNVRFANMEGGSRPDMATLKELRAHIALEPLLSSEFEVKEFLLIEPDILLEVDKNGRANWAVGGESSADGGSATAGSTDNQASEDGASGDVKLGDVRLVDGRVQYIDAQSGTSETFENLNMTVSLPNLDSALALDGGLAWHGKGLTLKVGAANPRALADGGKSGFSIAVTGEPLNFNFDGNLDTGALEAAGRLSLDVPSVKGLADWAGSPIDVQGNVLGPLSIKGDLAASIAGIAFTGMELAIDDISGTGEVNAAIGGAVPTITGGLNLAKLDLNPYLAAFGGGAEAGSAGQGSAPAGASGWSDDPIDFSALRGVNADLSLDLGALIAQQINVGKSAVKLVLNGGKLSLDLSEMALYGGNGSMKLNVDATGKSAVIANSFSLTGLQAEPFLSDAADLDWLSGAAQFTMDVTTSGSSQKQLANALNGTGRMSFTDGAVRGTNLAALLRGIATLQLDPGSWEESKTDFAELSGTFNIVNGVLQNQDMSLLSQLLRAGGKGTVGIGAQDIDYFVQPKAVASLVGQGGAADIAGVPIGIHIHGPWNNMQRDYQLLSPDGAVIGGLADLAKDPQALVQTLANLGAIKDPAALADKIEGLNPNVLEALKGLTGGDGDGANPADLLKKVIPGAGGDGSGDGAPNPADLLKKVIPGASADSADGGNAPKPADLLKKVLPGAKADQQQSGNAQPAPADPPPKKEDPLDALKSGTDTLKNLFNR